MSTISTALATALQNSDTIGPLVSGVIPGRNFELQDSLLNSPDGPHACISVIDLPIQQTSYLNSPGGRIAGQMEVRCISKVSEYAAKYLANLVSQAIWQVAGTTKIYQKSDTDENMQSWHEILTVDYRS